LLAECCCFRLLAVYGCLKKTKNDSFFHKYFWFYSCNGFQTMLESIQAYSDCCNEKIVRIIIRNDVLFNISHTRTFQQISLWIIGKCITILCMCCMDVLAIDFLVVQERILDDDSHRGRCKFFIFFSPTIKTNNI
jgi:hypothetical protein